MPAALISKIGDDGIGEQIVAELENDHIQTNYLIRAFEAPSPFTYIIVDKAGGVPEHVSYISLEPLAVC